MVRVATAFFPLRPRLLVIRQPELIIRRTMKAYIQFLGEPSPEGPPSIIVHYDSQRYMFNCREGTQRLCVEEKVRLGKLKSVFMTRMTWDCIGGLSGMLLTLADAGVRHLDLYGSKNLTHFMAATRHFVYRTSMTVETHEVDGKSAVSDKGPLTVTPVPILPNNYNNNDNNGSRNKRRRIDSESEQKDMEYRRKVIREMLSNDPEKCSPRQTGQQEQPLNSNNKPCGLPVKLLRTPLPYTSPYPAAVSFICRGPTVPGKFHVERAQALGLKPGPIYGQLQRGMTVTLEDGRVIEPSQVLDPPVPGHVFLVIDCPNVQYLDGLLASEAFAKYQTEEAVDRPVAVIHLIGEDVLNDARYREWMRKFSSHTEHIISAENVCAQSVLFRKHTMAQVKASRLNEAIFPVPKYRNTPLQELTQYDDLPAKCTPLKNMLQFDLAPRAGVCQESLKKPYFDHTDMDSPHLKKILQNEEYLDAVKKAKEEASMVQVDNQFPGNDVQVITLGTGSSVPSKYRNVSATLVKIPNYGSILLDAGEGTLGQMMRLFGHHGLNRELDSIRCIFVSHLHADHHLGVIQLLSKWYSLNRDSNKKLFVTAPNAFRLWLQDYCGVQDFGFPYNIRFIGNQHILPSRQPFDEVLANYETLKQALGAKEFNAVEVFHCRWAYGLSMVHESGWKLVYSGDTRPCDTLIEAGKDATLLIHEASLEDDMIAEALAKRHSTISEAIEVGKKMNARFTLLNHFSQRYPKMPALSKDHDNVCLSFDLMTIAIRQLEFLPKYTQALKLCFKEEEGDENEEE